MKKVVLFAVLFSMVTLSAKAHADIACQRREKLNQ